MKSHLLEILQAHQRGTAGDLAGTIDTKNDITMVAGSAGTTVTGQFVVGLTLD